MLNITLSLIFVVFVNFLFFICLEYSCAVRHLVCFGLYMCGILKNKTKNGDTPSCLQRSPGICEVLLGQAAFSTGIGGGIEPFPENPSSQMDKCCTKNTAKTQKKLACYDYISIK